MSYQPKRPVAEAETGAFMRSLGQHVRLEDLGCGFGFEVSDLLSGVQAASSFELEGWNLNREEVPLRLSSVYITSSREGTMPAL